MNYLNLSFSIKCSYYEIIISFSNQLISLIQRMTWLELCLCFFFIRNSINIYKPSENCFNLKHIRKKLLYLFFITLSRSIDKREKTSSLVEGGSAVEVWLTEFISPLCLSVLRRFIFPI